jgi:hypothetical protein
MISSESVIGREKLRIGQPHSIDSGNVSMTLLDVQDYRVPIVPGVQEKVMGFATARFDFRVGNRNIGPLDLSTTEEYGQHTSLELAMPLSSMLEPYFVYEFILEIIEPRLTMEGRPAPSSIVVELKIIRREKSPNVILHGDRSRLAAPDRRFVEYWAHIASTAEQQGIPFTELVAQKSGPVLTVAKKTIRLIESFRVTMDPESTGAIEVSFYKSDSGEYFFRRAGGCVAYQDLLFGPFRDAGGEFRVEEGKRELHH